MTTGTTKRRIRNRPPKTREQVLRRRRKVNEMIKDGKATNLVKEAAKKPLVRALYASGVGPLSIAVRLNLNHQRVLEWLRINHGWYYGDAIQ